MSWKLREEDNQKTVICKKDDPCKNIQNHKTYQLQKKNSNTNGNSKDRKSLQIWQSVISNATRRNPIHTVKFSKPAEDTLKDKWQA